jgi:hypothetical protein
LTEEVYYDKLQVEDGFIDINLEFKNRMAKSRENAGQRGKINQTCLKYI